MKVPTFPHWASAALLLAVLSASRTMAGPGSPPEVISPPARKTERAGSWRFSAGYLWRQVGALQWESRSSILPGTVPFLLPTGLNYSAPAAGTGPLENHEYEDGYVRPDAGTARDGDTWNWGYERDSQFADGNLSFQSTYTAAASSSRESLASNRPWEEDLESSGFSLALDSPGLHLGGNSSLGLTLGYNLVREETGRDTPGYAARQTSSTSVVRLTDRYDAGGIIPPLAPWQGSAEGPGPLIKATPVRTTSTATRSNDAFLSSRIEQTLELDLHTLSFGPVIHWQPADKLLLNFSAGLTVNIASYEANQTETLTAVRTFRSGNKSQRQSSTLSSTRHTDSGTEVLPGFYMAGTTTVLLSPRWSLFATGRYDCADKLNFTTGPSQGSLDLKGWSVQAGLSFGF